jgi:hypothetical protein
MERFDQLTLQRLCVCWLSCDPVRRSAQEYAVDSVEIVSLVLREGSVINLLVGTRCEEAARKGW